MLGNPLGDPTLRRVPIYLPPDYDESKRYPTVYLLAPFGSRGLKMLADELWEDNIQERLDRLILSNSMRPMIAVMPDASTRYGGSEYVNSSATGNYEDHVLELVEFIDQRYPTLADADHRAVAGHSSGGFAATRFGMRHPNLFGLIADHSGDKYFELTYKTSFPHLLSYFVRHGEEGFARLLKDPGAELQKGAPFQALSVAAVAACFSPNPKAPHGFDLPFDLHTGELIPEVWERWLAFDPVEIVENYSKELRSLRLLFFDCGLFDEYNLLYGARIFDNRLKALDIPHTYEEFEGGHRHIRYRFDTSLKAISQAMPQTERTS
ncbi:MAG: alpha/beta hydrolase-fold protein [Chloroflexi bacterium]|nr:alpha/beta hydrolase-fold protein [Chloroflexota bacterium]